MLQARIWPLVGLSFITPGLFQPAWSDPVSDGLTQSSVYICQFGETVHAYVFKVGAAGQLEGLGPLQGWSAVAQAGGLVASTAGQMLIIGEGPDSLVQDGQLVQGQCADAAGELAQLFDNGSLDAALGNTEAEPSNDFPADLALPEKDVFAPGIQPVISDDWLAGVLAILDPQAWETAKVAAIVDALSLDHASKMGLKAALMSAGNDPARIRAVARQIQHAIGVEVSSAVQLRARLQDTRRDLEATTRALEEQRQRVQNISAQLTGAEARAGAAERTQNQTAALLGAARRAISQKDAELGRSAQNLAALNHRLVAAQQQVVTLQTALNVTAEDQRNANFQIGTLTEQLAVTRARLARANNRIDELRAGRN